MASAAAPPSPPVVQCFTSNGTWSCCTGTTCVEVVAIGAGAAGQFVIGCCIPGTTVNQKGGPGGGAGGVIICNLSSGFGTTQCVVIGAGGTSCAGFSCNCSSPGGASCFGCLVIANGGALGTASIITCNNNACSIAGGIGGNSSSNGGCTQGGGCNLPSGCVAFISGNAGGAGQTISGKPGGGGGGGSNVSRQDGAPFLAKGNGGVGGSCSCICGITLGAGGGGNNSGQSGVDPGPKDGSPGVCFGAGGGGGGALPANANAGASSKGGAGFQGIIQVTQFFT